MDFRHILISRAKPRHKVQHGWNLYRKAIKSRKITGFSNLIIA